jgi:pyruvate formate lyase activating enzyme
MKHEVLVSDIQKFSVNDGPGFRTIVFLKGCPLNCAWCHNPETMSPFPEIYWKNRLCVQCGACLEVCPNQAINPPISPEQAMNKDTKYHKIIRERCDRCMACVDACRYDALSIVGKQMSVDEILDEVEKDRPFYDNSGGGMTLSGGEPTLHANFSISLLKNAKLRGIHTCLDTNGFREWETFRQVVEYADLVMFDLKHMDRSLHKKMTGVDNINILNNLSLLSTTGKEIWVRIPVIPGFNDTLDFHDRASDFLSNLPGTVSRVDLLPFHNWCQDKYGWLGIDWPMKDVEAMDPSFLEIPADLYIEKGLQATVGGSGFENCEQAVG